MQNLDTQSDEFPRARLINLAGLRERASIPTEWLIEGIYPLGEIILMVGEPHSGKTYVALDQGLAVAYGAPWLGIYDVPRPRPVLYVPTEGSGAGFVIIDVLADVTPGVDENSKEMGDMFARLRSLSNKTKVTYLVLHHFGKNAARGPRGHSSLHAVTDLQVAVTDQTVPDGSGGIMMTAVRLTNLRSEGGKNRNEDPWSAISVDLHKVRPDDVRP